MRQSVTNLNTKAEGDAKTYEAGVNLIAEYNLLVRKAKALFKDDRFIHAYQEMRLVNEPDVIIEKVITLANELETGMASY